MSAVYAFFVAVFVYKDMTLKKVPKVLLDSANMSAMLLYIITNAVMFSFLMTSEQIPQIMAEWMLDKGLGQVAFLLFVNVLLLLAGNVMEPSSIVLIMAPILFPVAMKLGIDPVHFGIMMTVNMEVGMCHPPVGLNLYVASGITKMGITELTVAVWPWLLTMLIFLVMVTYWPAMSLCAAKSPGHDQLTGLPARFCGTTESGRGPASSPGPFVCVRTIGTAGTALRRLTRRGKKRPLRGIILNLLGIILSEPKNGGRTHPFHHQTGRRGQERDRRDLFALRERRPQDRRGEDDLARATRRRRLLRGASRAAVFQGPGRIHDLRAGDDPGARR